MEKNNKMMRCRVSACYWWKKGRVRHIEVGSFEIVLTEDELEKLQSKPAARVALFKKHFSPLDEVSRNEVIIEVL